MIAQHLHHVCKYTRLFCTCSMCIVRCLIDTTRYLTGCSTVSESLIFDSIRLSAEHGMRPFVSGVTECKIGPFLLIVFGCTQSTTPAHQKATLAFLVLIYRIGNADAKAAIRISTKLVAAIRN